MHTGDIQILIGGSMKLGIIGFGQMGMAVARGLIESGALRPSEIYACGRDFEKLRKNADRLGINAVQNALEAVGKADVILLSVKPYQAAEVLTPLKNALRGRLIVSVLAGKSESELGEHLDSSTEIICALPNTPCEVGKGIWIVRPSARLSYENESRFRDLFGKIGHIEMLEGAAADAAGAIAGCGPAFAAMFLEALGDSGVRHGLSRAQSYRIAAEMMGGLAELYLRSGQHPAALKDQVTSPGGTTIRGVLALEKHGFRCAVEEAVSAVIR